MDRKRCYGIDLLRMISMFMVIVLHLCGHGGVLSAFQTSSKRFWFAWLLEISAYCAVNCYALISGYVGVDSKYRYSRIFLLWLQVIFYTVSITVLFSGLHPEVLTSDSVVNALFPVMKNQYWYFRCYFFVFFIIPILNMGIKGMNRTQLAAVLVGLLGLYSVMQTVMQNPIFGTGYNELWLMILYLVGGSIKKRNMLNRITVWMAFWGYIIAVLATWLSKLIIHYMGGKCFGIIINEDVLVSYYSPTILFAGIFLFLFFQHLSLPIWVNRIVGYCSPMAFGVYLIHEHPLIRSYYITSRFAPLTSLRTPLMILGVLGYALIIYFICSIIDLLRLKLCKAIRLKEYIIRHEDKWIKLLWNNQ